MSVARVAILAAVVGLGFLLATGSLAFANNDTETSSAASDQSVLQPGHSETYVPPAIVPSAKELAEAFSRPGVFEVVRSRRIAMIQFYTPSEMKGNLAKYFPALYVKSCYAAKHGYSFIVDTLEADDAVLHKTSTNHFNKILALQRHLARYEWLFWHDSDTVIMAPDRKLEDFLELAVSEPGIGLVLTDHSQEVNNGAFFIRNSVWGKWFLDSWWAWSIKKSRAMNRVPDTNKNKGWYGDNASMLNLVLELVFGTPAGRKHQKQCRPYDRSCRQILNSRDLDRCFQQQMTCVGQGYGERRVPGVKFFSPNENSTERLVFNNWGGGQRSSHPTWRESDWYHPGDFLMHTKWMDWFAPSYLTNLSCSAVLDEYRAPGSKWGPILVDDRPKKSNTARR